MDRTSNHVDPRPAEPGRGDAPQVIDGSLARRNPHSSRHAPVESSGVSLRMRGGELATHDGAGPGNGRCMGQEIRSVPRLVNATSRRVTRMCVAARSSARSATGCRLWSPTRPNSATYPPHYPVEKYPRLGSKGSSLHRVQASCRGIWLRQQAVAAGSCFQTGVRCPSVHLASAASDAMHCAVENASSLEAGRLKAAGARWMSHPAETSAGLVTCRHSLVHNQRAPT